MSEMFRKQEVQNLDRVNKYVRGKRYPYKM